MANRPPALLRSPSIPFFIHFVRGFAAWAVLCLDCVFSAVGESEEQRKPERFSGYRKAEREDAAPHQDTAAAHNWEGGPTFPTIPTKKQENRKQDGKEFKTKT